MSARNMSGWIGNYTPPARKEFGPISTPIMVVHKADDATLRELVMGIYRNPLHGGSACITEEEKCAGLFGVNDYADVDSSLPRIVRVVAPQLWTRNVDPFQRRLEQLGIGYDTHVIDTDLEYIFAAKPEPFELTQKTLVRAYRVGVDGVEPIRG